MSLKNKAKKIVFLLGSYLEQNRGGAELQAYYLAREAVKLGFELHYIFLSDGKDYSNSLNLDLHPIRMRTLWSKLDNIKYPYTKQLWHILGMINPDVIYQRGGTSFTGLAAIYAKRQSSKLIFHIAHDSDVQLLSFPFTKPWLIPEYKFIQSGIRNANTIIAQTQFQAEQLQRNYGRRSIVILNGHPVSEEYIKKDKQITILWIANWKPIKQPELFVRLVEKINIRENLRFIMLGRTDRYCDLVEKARKNSIEVMGEVPNEHVNSLLERSSILINTSVQEGFSNTFIQAWIRKVPVVSLQVDPDGVLKKKRIGYCSGNFQKLVRDTKRLIKDPELLHDMGNRAREYAITNHSLNNMDNILKVIAD